MAKNYNVLRRATLLTGSTLTVMAGAIIAPALPQISREFADVPGVELLSRLILTLPALFMGILAPLAGYFTDRAGRKKVLIFSLILYAIAGTSGLYLNSLPAILVGRAFLGIAVGGLITAILTLIGDYYEGEERNRFMGTQAAFAGMGGLIFISSGGVLADIHWRMPFLIYIASLLVLAGAVVSVNEPARKTPAINSAAGGNGSGSFPVPASVILICAIAFFSAIVFYMIPTQMPFMLSAMEGVSNTGIGFAIAFVNVASVTTSLNYGRIRKRMGYRSIMGLVFVLIFAGYLIISMAGSYVMMIVGILVSGLGFGFMMPNINLWLISEAPAPLRGRMVGYLNAALFSGMFISPVALQPLILIGGLYNSFLLMGFILLAFAVLLFLMEFMYKRTQTRVLNG